MDHDTVRNGRVRFSLYVFSPSSLLWCAGRSASRMHFSLRRGRLSPSNVYGGEVLILHPQILRRPPPHERSEE